MGFGFRTIIINFVLIGLFMSSFFSFMFLLSTDNGLSSGFYDTDNVNLTGLNNRLNVTRSEAENVRTSFENENPILEFGSLVFNSIIFGGRTLTSGVIETANIIFDFGESLGIPSIVFGLIVAILLIVLVFSAWETYKSGRSG